MTRSEAPSHRAQILLLASEREVYAFDLSEHFRIAIGRHEANDVALPSRTVSSFHAEILNEAEGLAIHDLRSTNGTFLNEERVSRHPIQDGDRIRIASYVLAVNLVASKSHWKGRNDAIDVGAAGRLIPLGSGSSEEIKKTLPAAGLRDLSLPDLLMVLNTNRRSVMVAVRGKEEEGRIAIEKGRIVHATCGRNSAEKALYRLFGLSDATYEILPPPEGENFRRTITLPTETLVAEGAQQASAIRTLIAQLPAFDVPLGLVEYCPLPLSALSPGEIEIFQSLMRLGTIRAVLEDSPLTDFRILSLIQALHRKKVIDVAVDPEDGRVETHVLRRDELMEG